MTDADDITALDDATVERIAAGEVVERPASAVKELVENALDAGATRVRVAVERGGTEAIRVSDDGEGLTEAAVRRAVRPHTTSKIRDAADLDAGVDTLGFRGEALSTIAAVSRVTIRTKPPGADAGTELRMAGGDVRSVDPVGCPAGTTVEVTDLFYNTPARERYLKQDRTEFGRVNDVVTKYALARPDVAVSLEHDGREVFATTGQGDLRAAILATYGREVAGAMVPVEADPAGPLDAVSGYVSHPETTRSSREYVAAFVNGRYVQSGAAREAVVAAYGGQLAADRYPFAVLDLSVPPGDVDVNVHPRKMEVRFADEDGVRDAVERAVREALLAEGLARSSAPRGRSAPAEATVEPEWPDDEEGDPGDEANEEGEVGTSDAEADDEGETGTSDAEADDEGETGTSDAEGETGPSHAEGRSGSDGGAATAGDRGPALRDEVACGRHDDGDGSGEAGWRPPGGPDGDGSRGVGTGDGDAASGDGEADGNGRAFDATEQRTLDGATVSDERSFDALPPLRVLGQYDDTYVVAAAPDGLVLVDQHAADERVQYERLRERFEGGVAAQSLAEPAEVAVTAGEAELLEDYREPLARLGFEAARTGERSVTVSAVPTVLAQTLDPELVGDVLSSALSAGAGDGPVAAGADDLLADLACHPAVTGNTPLTEGSVVDLLAALDDCENPWACPHGRPTVIHLDDDEIAGRFERDYPGH